MPGLPTTAEPAGHASFNTLLEALGAGMDIGATF